MVNQTDHRADRMIAVNGSVNTSYRTDRSMIGGDQSHSARKPSRRPLYLPISTSPCRQRSPEHRLAILAEFWTKLSDASAEFIAITGLKR
jgi:hypothetical protein